MGAIDHFLRYLAAAYPAVQSQLFGKELDHAAMDRHLQWIKKVCEPQTKEIQQMFLDGDQVTSQEKRDKFVAYEAFILKKLEKLKGETDTDYFSNQY